MAKALFTNKSWLKIQDCRVNYLNKIYVRETRKIDVSAGGKILPFLERVRLTKAKHGTWFKSKSNVKTCR